jgi:hypothetical protein
MENDSLYFRAGSKIIARGILNNHYLSRACACCENHHRRTIDAVAWVSPAHDHSASPQSSDSSIDDVPACTHEVATSQCQRRVRKLPGFCF